MVVERPSAWMWTPWQSLPTCLWKVGSNQISRNLHPASQSDATRSISFITASASMSGAPNVSSGRVVPLPSLSVVPSSMTVPA